MSVLPEDRAVLGAHDALTAYPPRHFWDWAAIPFCRCQSRRPEDPDGEICYDFRVSFDSKGNTVARHGATAFKVDVASLLESLDSRAMETGLAIWIRLLLEKGETEADGFAFWSFCRQCQNSYSSLRFFGGFRKKDGKTIYDFGSGIWDLGDNSLEDNDVIQLHASMASDARWYEKLIPRLYARRMNASLLSSMQEKHKGKIVLMDFI